MIFPLQLSDGGLFPLVFIVLHLGLEILHCWIDGSALLPRKDFLSSVSPSWVVVKQDHCLLISWLGIHCPGQYYKFKTQPL